MKKLAIITTHPIQYNAPFFKMLAGRRKVDVKVFYTWSQAQSTKKFDPGFGADIEWDIPLLEGYPYTFVSNISKRPGSDHFRGIHNPGLITEIEAWHADAILVYGWSFRSHFKAIRYFHKKIPVLFRGDSTLMTERPGVKQLMRRIFLRYVYSFIDFAGYVGVENRKYFLKHGLKDHQLFFMPHAVDNDRYISSEKTKAATLLREKFMIPDAALVFIFAGKLDKNKNAAQLCTAFLKACDSNSFLMVVGSGPEEKQLLHLFGDHAQIRFAGFRNQADMPLFYAMGNVYVMPSVNETWGLGINEAMASGLPIICSAGCGAAADLVKPNENGFVTEVKNEEALVKAMRYFIDAPDEAKRMGKRSVEKIREYSYEHDCPAIENIINASASGRS